MAFDPKRLLEWRFEPIRHSYDERDAILYALGLGAPRDPLDVRELEFLLEDRLKVLPTFASTLASPGMWVRAPQLEIDWVRLLHSAQAATFRRPLPRKGEVVGEARIKSLYDRGIEKGAVCVVERRISDAASGDLYCTLEHTLAMRGDGGFGGDPPPKPERAALPRRQPDVSDAVSVSARAALIYRLSGDVNPIHADPDTARKAGFERPILHGLASYGIAGAAIIRHFCGYDSARLVSLSVRFAGVVTPGDTLDFAFWREHGVVRFTASVAGRIVLDQGAAELTADK